MYDALVSYQARGGHEVMILLNMICEGDVYSTTHESSSQDGARAHPANYSALELNTLLSASKYFFWGNVNMLFELNLQPSPF